VLESQVQNGFETDAAVEVMMQIDQGEFGVDHEVSDVPG
jgi:hypothetical protein